MRLTRRSAELRVRVEYDLSQPPREGRGDVREQYRARRNGMPISTPYVYGAPRAAWATNKLDLAAIRAADAGRTS